MEYNDKQTRDDRKIDNYFNKISDDTKHDLACEIVIELGNMEYWDEKSLEYKYQMTQVFEQQLEDIQEIVPDFYIANATIHFDEHSPLNKKEIDKATKHINNEMDEYAEEFYEIKKTKDDEIER